MAGPEAALPPRLLAKVAFDAFSPPHSGPYLGLFVTRESVRFSFLQLFRKVHATAALRLPSPVVGFTHRGPRRAPEHRRVLELLGRRHQLALDRVVEPLRRCLRGLRFESERAGLGALRECLLWFLADYLPCAVARRAAWRFGRAQRGGSGSLTGSACAGVHRRRSVAAQRSLAQKRRLAWLGLAWLGLAWLGCG